MKPISGSAHHSVRKRRIACPVCTALWRRDMARRLYGGSINRGRETLPKTPCLHKLNSLAGIKQDEFNVLLTPATRRPEALGLARVQTAPRPRRHTEERGERCGAETQQRRSLSEPCLDIVPLKAHSGRDGRRFFPNRSQEPSACERVLGFSAASRIGSDVFIG